MTGPRRVVLAIALAGLGGLGFACSGGTNPRATGTTVPSSAPTSATTRPPTVAGTTVPGAVTPTSSAATSATSAATVTTRVTTVQPVGTTAPGPPPASSGKGGIAGHVYLNCGGAPPSGGACQTRQGVPGVTITATAGNAIVATAVTDAAGSYRMDVPAGLYGLEDSRDHQSTRVQVQAGLIVVADFTVP